MGGGPTLAETRSARHEIVTGSLGPMRCFHAQWHCQFFLDRIQGHVGETFSYEAACAPLLDLGESEGPIHDAVTGLLSHLSFRGFVTFDARGSFASHIRVIADASSPKLLRTTPAPSRQHDG